jgi:hypothetical protein
LQFSQPTEVNTSAENSDTSDMSSLGCTPIPGSPTLSRLPSAPVRTMGLQLQPSQAARQPSLGLSHHASPSVLRLAHPSSPSVLRLAHPSSPSVLRLAHPSSRSVLRLPQTRQPAPRLTQPASLQLLPQQHSFDNAQEK